jgi:hypothetical protein
MRRMADHGRSAADERGRYITRVTVLLTDQNKTNRLKEKARCYRRAASIC